MKKSNVYTLEEAIEIIELTLLERGVQPSKITPGKFSIRGLARQAGMNANAVCKQLDGSARIKDELLDFVGMKWGIVDAD